MAKEHDEYQSGQFPEDLFSIKSEYDSHAVKECDGDGHANQCHHAGLSAFQFIEAPFDERPSTIEIHKSGQGSHNINITWKTPIHTHEILNHWREEHDGDGDDQYDKKLIAKFRHHITVIIAPVTMIAVVVMTFMIMRTMMTFMIVVVVMTVCFMIMMLMILFIVMRRLIFIMIHFTTPYYLSHLNYTL